MKPSDVTQEMIDRFNKELGNAYLINSKLDPHACIHIAAAVNAVLGNDFVVMPKSLTAENGAKGLLSGEFKKVIVRENPCGCDSPEDCDLCRWYEEAYPDGTEEFVIPWTTIKAIYAMAVKNLAVKQ